MVCSRVVGLSQSSLGWRVGDGRRPSLALLGRTDRGFRMVVLVILGFCRVVAIGVERGERLWKDVDGECQWVRWLWGGRGGLYLVV